MPQVNVNHSFVSTKPDSADSSLVSSSEWNAPEVFSGGSQGQALVRDGGSPTGASWINATAGTVATETYSGAAPSTTLADTVITFTTSALLFIFINVNSIVSDSSNTTIFVKRNGVLISQYVIHGTGIASCQVIARAEVAGSITLTVEGSLSSGTFTSISATMSTLVIGTV